MATRGAAERLISRVVLVEPDTIARALERIRATGRVSPTPNVWQITLGVLRMWHRVLFRSDTVGQSTTDPVRSTTRARLFVFRPLRFPFLLRERAVAPLDFSGLISSRDRVVSHLLGAHHDGNQFVYDLEMLSLFGANEPLEEARARAKAIVDGTSPRADFMRDLCVYERYHEHLVEAIDAFLDGDDRLSDREREDPDISFFAYLAWCGRQPRTADETLNAMRLGNYSIADGVRARAP